MNVPYRKKYDEKGLLINPINGQYTQPFENRRSRRHRGAPFRGNKKGVSLTVSQNIAYKRIVQVIKDGNFVKRILHYLPKIV